MTKLRPSLKNLASCGLFNLGLILTCVTLIGCSSSTTPTYPKEDIAKAIRDICQKEYKTAVSSYLVGETLWVYLPLDNLITPTDKPEKYTEKFDVTYIKVKIKDGNLQVRHLIRPIQEEEKLRGAKYNEKVNSVFRVLYRIIFSTDLKQGGPKIFSLVAADIKNGIEVREIFYYLDLKKAVYQFISWGEFQHRSIQEINLSPQIIGDKDGLHVIYKEIQMKDFIAGQIENRIKIKFQKPEVGKNADIDKEIAKIIVYTLRIYDFKGFETVEIDNLFTKAKTFLNRQAVWARAID